MKCKIQRMNIADIASRTIPNHSMNASIPFALFIDYFELVRSPAQRMRVKGQDMRERDDFRDLRKDGGNLQVDLRATRVYDVRAER